MRETIIGVTAKILNIPDKFDLSESGYMVVKVIDAEMWYYGFYDDEEKANQAANEIENGAVLKL